MVMYVRKNADDTRTCADYVAALVSMSPMSELGTYCKGSMGRNFALLINKYVMHDVCQGADEEKKKNNKQK